jgi:hypothetical protein
MHLSHWANKSLNGKQHFSRKKEETTIAHKREPTELVLEAGLPDFSWSKHSKLGKMYNK